MSCWGDDFQTETDNLTPPIKGCNEKNLIVHHSIVWSYSTSET